MTREEYVADIKLDLGHPIVTIENESVLDLIVDQAFKEVKSHITEVRFVTIPYSDKGINVKEYDINTVVQIFRISNPSRVSDFTDIYSMSCLNNNNSSQTNLLLSDYLYRTQMNQLKSTMTTDLDFTYDKKSQVLYINTFHPRPSKVTVAYIPEFKDVSEVTEQHWINKIQRLALALSKISLGRIRSKYNLSSALYSLDGDQLISEGISERDQVRQELSDESDLAFPID